MTDLKKVLLQQDEDLSTVEHRLRFIMDALCPESDWIEKGAATGLYYTLNSIVDDIHKVMQAAKQAVQS